MSRLHRDPRHRPPDPAGTRPNHDPEALLPRAPLPLRDDRDDPGTPGGDHGFERPESVVAVAEPAPAVDADAREVPAADAARSSSRYSARFQFILGALVAIAIAALGTLGLVLTSDHSSANSGADLGVPWSAWQPSGDGDPVMQIAQHVAQEYRLPDGKQLVAVTASALQVGGLPVTVALREPVSTGNGDIKLFDGTGVMYNMCGLGKNCSIAEGKPSEQRGLLLYREALELALYSFRYVGVDQAVVFVPAAHGKKPTHALYFRRSQLAGELARPLDATLSDQAPTVQNIKRWPDTAMVNQLASGNVFKASFVQGNQEPRAFLVLDPP